MTTQKLDLEKLPNVDKKTVEQDHAAYKKNEEATEKNVEKDNKPKTRFDNPDQIKKNENPRNEGDVGGNSD